MVPKTLQSVPARHPSLSFKPEAMEPFSQEPQTLSDNLFSSFLYALIVLSVL